MEIYNEMMAELGFPAEYFHPVEEKVVEAVMRAPQPVSFIPLDDWQRHCDPTSDESPWFALEYADVYRASKTRIHRYSRRARFKFTLFQLLGLSGEVSINVIDLIRTHPSLQKSPSKIWNSVRQILKLNGLRKYYNRIPYIVRVIADYKIEGITDDKLNSMLDDFWAISFKFDNELRAKWNLSYFLNMRFVALSLMEKYNITYPYNVPLARTARKRRYLSNLFHNF